MSHKKVAIIGSRRIPFVKSLTQYWGIQTRDLMAASLEAVVQSYGLSGKRLDEVCLGAVIKHPREFNLARESVLSTSLHPDTSAYDVQRACGTSLTAVDCLANSIALGKIDVAIAGGVDSNSRPPLAAKWKYVEALLKAQVGKSVMQKVAALASLRPSDILPDMPSVNEPRTGLSMGDHCELMAKEWKISRGEQDQFAYESHHKAAKAMADGFFKDLIVEFKGIKKDGILRGDTTVEKLAKLKPAFDRTPTGTITAGNASALTDGSSAVLLCSEEYAQKQGWQAQAYFKDSQSYAVDFIKGEGLLMGPAYAVSELLKRHQLKLQDFDLYEIHEAFAAQVLCTLRAWESDKFCQERLKLPKALGAIDPTKINVVGSSLAVGHPFAATGTRIVGTLAKLLKERNLKRGLISICTAGGMGVAAIVER